MWGSRLRARSASDIFDPSTVFCSSNQTQDGWSSNGPPLHLLSFSVCLPSTLHSRTATTICRLRDDGTSSSSVFYFFYFSMGAVEYFITWQSFRVRLNIWGFFSQRAEKVREDVLEVRERERRAEDGRREEEKLGTKEMQRKMKRRNKKKTKSAPSSPVASSPPSLPSVPTAWSPATPAEVPFSSPQAHSAGFAW